jgi:Skp family chaperone for outer membrane proteins
MKQANNGTHQSHQTGEHVATNKDVADSNKRWGLAQIAAVCVAFSTIGAFATGFWSSAVQAGGKDHFVTVEQHAAVVRQVEALDAGVQEQLKKMQLDSDRKHQEYREDMRELNRSIQKLVQQKGGK